MEAATLSGKWTTGLVTTTRITHATPASFSAHVIDRNSEADIAVQQATYQHVDLLFGGGAKFFNARADGRDLFSEMQDRGYKVATTYQQFSDLRSTDVPLIGLFAPDNIDYEIDRRRVTPPTQPSLYQMATKALDLLVAQDKPFFVMIEAGRIDMAERMFYFFHFFHFIFF
jgi:alkaline phosphatase